MLKNWYNTQIYARKYKSDCIKIHTFVPKLFMFNKNGDDISSLKILVYQSNHIDTIGYILFNKLGMRNKKSAFKDFTDISMVVFFLGSIVTKYTPILFLTIIRMIKFCVVFFSIKYDYLKDAIEIFGYEEMKRLFFNKNLVFELILYFLNIYPDFKFSAIAAQAMCDINTETSYYKSLCIILLPLMIGAAQSIQRDKLTDSHI